jgi:hypothetical protein
MMPPPGPHPAPGMPPLARPRARPGCPPQRGSAPRARGRVRRARGGTGGSKQSEWDGWSRGAPAGCGKRPQGFTPPPSPTNEIVGDVRTRCCRHHRRTRPRRTFDRDALAITHERDRGGRSTAMPPPSPTNETVGDVRTRCLGHHPRTRPWGTFDRDATAITHERDLWGRSTAMPPRLDQAPATATAPATRTAPRARARRRREVISAGCLRTGHPGAVAHSSPSVRNVLFH